MNLEPGPEDVVYAELVAGLDDDFEGTRKTVEVPCLELTLLHPECITVEVEIPDELKEQAK